MKRRSTWIIILIIILLLGSSALYFFLFPKHDSYKTPIVITGTIVTPLEVIDPGWILIEDGIITSVSNKKIDNPIYTVLVYDL